MSCSGRFTLIMMVLVLCAWREVAPAETTLGSVQTVWSNALEKLEGEHTIRLEELQTRYGIGLKAYRARYGAKGETEAVVFFDKEAERFAAEKSVPRAWGNGDYGLSRLRAGYWKAADESEAKKDEQMVALLGKYLPRLQQLQKRQVIADEIDEALGTRAEIEEKKKLYVELRERLQLRREIGRSGFDNLGFEKGLAGWKPSGDGHQVEPFVSDGGKPVEGKMAYQTSLGSGAISPSQDALTNQLVSAVFLAPLRKANFSAYLWGGARDSMYVALVSASNHKELCRLGKAGTGANWERVKQPFRLSGSRRVYIRIVDKHSGGWGHLGVDRIEFLE
jgi:hypothetical protein